MQLSIKITFGVKPQEVNTVTLEIKRFTLSSTANAKKALSSLKINVSAL